MSKLSLWIQGTRIMFPFLFDHSLLPSWCGLDFNNFSWYESPTFITFLCLEILKTTLLSSFPNCYDTKFSVVSFTNLKWKTKLGITKDDIINNFHTWHVRIDPMDLVVDVRSPLTIKIKKSRLLPWKYSQQQQKYSIILAWSELSSHRPSHYQNS